MSYNINGKIYTENPMVDEMVHNAKLIMNDIVLKDSDRADECETEESIRDSDLYVSICGGSACFEMFYYDRQDLLKVNPKFTSKELYLYEYDNSKIPEQYRATLLQNAIDDFEYEEYNNYYRMLNGLPDYEPYDEDDEPGIYLSEEDIPEDIRGLFPLEERIPLHRYDPQLINLLKDRGILTRIQNDNPDCLYLYHLGENKIDIYEARTARRFDILYSSSEVEEMVANRFREIYEKNRILYLKRHYSKAFKYQNEYYDEFFMLMLVSQSVTDLITEIPEWYIRRDVFDARTVEYILESNGVKYFEQIPLKYQISLVRSLNKIIKYKSCNKNIKDLAAIFDFDDAVVSKYYLLKSRKCDVNGEYLDGEEGDDLYDLFFVKAPIDGTLIDSIGDNVNIEKYDTVTREDRYWDGPLDHDYVRQKILEKDFTYEITKYMSLEIAQNETDYQFQVAYFLNMLFNNNIDKSKLTVNVPIINAFASQFSIVDLFTLLYLLSFNFYANGNEKINDTIKHDRPDIENKVVPIIDNSYLLLEKDRELDNDINTEDFDDTKYIGTTLDFDGGTSTNEPYDAEGDGGTSTVVYDTIDEYNRQMVAVYHNVDGNRHRVQTGNDFSKIDPFPCEIYYKEGKEINPNKDLPADYVFRPMFNPYIVQLLSEKDEEIGSSWNNEVEVEATWNGEEDINQWKAYIKAAQEGDYVFLNVDLSNRVLGFNLEADMTFVNQLLDMYKDPNTFGFRGIKIGKVGVENFLTPNGSIGTPQELVNIYLNNKKCYDALKEKIICASNQYEKDLYMYLFYYLFTMEKKDDYFTLSTGEPATTYSEFLKDKNYILYDFYEKLMSESNPDIRRSNISTYVDQIIDSINLYLNCPELTGVYSCLEPRSVNVIIGYLRLLLNFFKSYKVTFLELGVTKIMGDELENNARPNDKIAGHHEQTYKSSTSVLVDVIVDQQIQFDRTDSFYIDDHMFKKDIYTDTFYHLSGGSSKQCHSYRNLDGNEPVQSFFSFEDSSIYIEDDDVKEEQELDGGSAEDDIYEIGIIDLDGTTSELEIDYESPIAMIEDWDGMSSAFVPFENDFDGGVANSTPKILINDWDDKENSYSFDDGYYNPDVHGPACNGYDSKDSPRRLIANGGGTTYYPLDPEYDLDGGRSYLGDDEEIRKLIEASDKNEKAIEELEKELTSILYTPIMPIDEYKSSVLYFTKTNDEYKEVSLTESTYEDFLTSGNGYIMLPDRVEYSKQHIADLEEALTWIPFGSILQAQIEKMKKEVERNESSLNTLMNNLDEILFTPVLATDEYDSSTLYYVKDDQAYSVVSVSEDEYDEFVKSGYITIYKRSEFTIKHTRDLENLLAWKNFDYYEDISRLDRLADENTRSISVAQSNLEDLLFTPVLATDEYDSSIPYYVKENQSYSLVSVSEDEYDEFVKRGYITIYVRTDFAMKHATSISVQSWVAFDSEDTKSLTDVASLN